MRRDLDKYYTLDAARSRLAQEPDAVRVALRQVLRAVSAYECRLPAARWFSGKRWRQLLGAAAREPAR